MRAGGGKAKGASNEREVCRKLSLWVSGGSKEDLYWRSAMSGGRATVARKSRNVTLASQAGDISSVDPAGHVLTDICYFETKHVASIGLDKFIVSSSGPLAKYWTTAKFEAKQYRKEPVLIIRQNRMPMLWISKVGLVKLLTGRTGITNYSLATVPRLGPCEIWEFDSVLSLPFSYEAEPPTGKLVKYV